MNSHDIAKAIKTEYDNQLSEEDTEKIVRIILKETTAAIAMDEKVFFNGFVSFRREIVNEHVAFDIDEEKYKFIPKKAQVEIETSEQLQNRINNYNVGQENE